MAKTLLIIKLLLVLTLLPVSQSLALSQTLPDPMISGTHNFSTMVDCEQMGPTVCPDMSRCPATNHSGCEVSGQLVLSAVNLYLGDNAGKLSIDYSDSYFMLLIETLLRPPRNV